MNSENNPLRPSWPLPIWTGALLVFLLVLAWAVSSINIQSAQERSKQQAAAAADPSLVLNLPQSPAAAAIPPFPEDQGYVLAGAGMQGFYQNSEPDEVWSLRYPTPKVQVQLIKRGPDFPQILTEGYSVGWELEGQSGTMQAVDGSFFSAEIPVRAMKADGGTAPYPVVNLQAKDANGEVLAESALVLAVSPGFGCYNCHADGGRAILEVHDRHLGTSLLERSAKGNVINCRSCHEDLPLQADTEETPDAEEAGVRRAPGFSASIHGWHSAFLSEKGADACMSCHVALNSTPQAPPAPPAPPAPMFARDFHIERGLDCSSCHGYMEDHALALLKAEEEAGMPPATVLSSSITPRKAEAETLAGRLPWVQEPDCASCHDFMVKPDPETASSFNKWTQPDRADQPDRGAATLFSARLDDMYMVRCISCHGAPHALYPARNPLAENLDNIQPLQYQQRAAPLGRFGNCAVCHGTPKDMMAHHPEVM